jgi:hypothetical protein
LLRLWDPVAYLVRSFQTNARIRSLTTGTFNRVVKDRIALRLSGANSVQANPHKCESDCPRNLTNIRCYARPCQRKRLTAFPPLFHNRKGGRFSVEAANWGAEISSGLKNNRENNLARKDHNLIREGRDLIREGHDFSRADKAIIETGLQPLRATDTLFTARNGTAFRFEKSLISAHTPKRKTEN